MSQLSNFARNFAKGGIVNTTLFRKEFRESPACPKLWPAHMELWIPMPHHTRCSHPHPGCETLTVPVVQVQPSWGYPRCRCSKVQASSGTCGAGTGHPRYRRCTVLYGAASSMLGWRVSTHSVEVCKGTERKRPNMSSEQHTQHTTHTPRRGREKSSHSSTLLSASAGGRQVWRSTSRLTETVGQTPEGRGDGRSTAAPLLSALAMDDSEQDFTQLGGGMVG